MTEEEYNQFDTDFEMLAANKHETYSVVNPALITGTQPCPLFELDRKERFAWGISRIYDNVRVADMRFIRDEIMYTLGKTVYYRIKQQRRVITEDEQETIRNIFTEMGYDGNAIQFDRYEEKYPVLMRLYKLN